MRLMSQIGMSEVRRTADSDTKRIGGQACPEQEVSPEDRGAWGGWRRNVRKCMFSNQGDLSRCRKERDILVPTPIQRKGPRLAVGLRARYENIFVRTYRDGQRMSNPLV